MLTIIQWIKQNLKSLLELLKESSIHITLKKKSAEESTKSIQVSNIFVIIVVIVVGLIIRYFIS